MTENTEALFRILIRLRAIAQDNPGVVRTLITDIADDLKAVIDEWDAEDAELFEEEGDAE